MWMKKRVKMEMWKILSRKKLTIFTNFLCFYYVMSSYNFLRIKTFEYLKTFFNRTIKQIKQTKWRLVIDA
jgi:hypothetical protein